MTDTVSQIVRDVPADLKQALSDRVDRDESNLNDVAVGILANRFSVPFAPSGRKTAGVGDSPDLVLRVPPDLRTKIKVAAARGGVPARLLILAAFREELLPVAA